MTQTLTSTKKIQRLSLKKLQHVDSPYSFRNAQASRFDSLLADLKKKGQKDPITVEAVSSSPYRVLDGFQRVKAAEKLGWADIECKVIPGPIEEKDRYDIIRKKNTFGLYEMSRFLKSFHDCGIPIKQMIRDTKFTPHQLEDLFELSTAKSTFGVLLNKSTIDPILALMLYRRYQSWIQTPFHKEALALAKKLLSLAKQERMTMKSWRFYLDFYWKDNRPAKVTP